MNMNILNTYIHTHTHINKHRDTFKYNSTRLTCENEHKSDETVRKNLKYHLKK